MRLSLCSFGRSFLHCHSGRSVSSRRVAALLRAARSRWPDGRLVRGPRSVAWVVPRGTHPAGSDLCGVLVHWKR